MRTYLTFKKGDITMSEIYEMEETTMDTYEGTVEDNTETSGKGLAPLLIAGGVALVGAAAVGVRTLVKKAKKDKEPKQKTKLKLVRVPVEEEVESEEVDDTENQEENE